MKIETILSLLANVALVVALGTTQNKLNNARAKAEQNDIESAEFVKLAVKIGYDAGCITAITEGHGVRPDDPGLQIYGDWCTKNAISFAKHVEFK
jgi:hypothetical protein